MSSAGLHDSLPEAMAPGVCGSADQIQEVPDVEVLSTDTRSIPSREAQQCPKVAWGGSSTDALGESALDESGTGDAVVFETDIQPVPDWDEGDDRAIDQQHKGFGQVILHGARMIF